MEFLLERSAGDDEPAAEASMIAGVTAAESDLMLIGARHALDRLRATVQLEQRVVDDLVLLQQPASADAAGATSEDRGRCEATSSSHVH